MATKTKKENVEAKEIVEAVEETVEVKEVAEKPAKAAKVQNGISGTYEASCLLNLREAADPEAEVVVVMPEGTKVVADGKVTKKAGNDWYSVKATIKGKEYSGFCVASFLAK